MFRNCLSIDQNYSKAREIIMKLERPSELDWYNWWFGSSKILKRRSNLSQMWEDKAKSMFGVVLLVSLSAFILSLLIVAYVNVVKGNFAQNTGLTGIIIVVGILVGMLLLPSLRKISVAGVELNTVAPSSIKSELTAVPSIDIKMPFEYPLESFSAPLQEPLHMPMQYPLRSVSMPVEYLPYPSLPHSQQS